MPSKFLEPSYKVHDLTLHNITCNRESEDRGGCSAHILDLEIASATVSLRMKC